MRSSSSSRITRSRPSAAASATSRCEDACTRGDVDRAVAIDEIKKFVAEQELQADKRYIPKVITHRGIADPYPEKIAIIGAGPAGLSLRLLSGEHGL